MEISPTVEAAIRRQFPKIADQLLAAVRDNIIEVAEMPDGTIAFRMDALVAKVIRDERRFGGQVH